MGQSRIGAGRLGIAVALAFSGTLFVGPSPASAAVSAVKGSALGYFTNVSLFGGPFNPRGPAPTVALPLDGTGSATPVTASVPSGNATYGPGIIFTSGPITVTTQGLPGPNGSVTTSTDIQNTNTSGQEVLTAPTVASTCTGNSSGVTGSTTFGANSSLVTDDGDATHAVVVVPVPTNPAPNTVIDGIVRSVGDTYRYIFNEQIVNPDGSLTVNAAHQLLRGPTALGDVIIGQSVCGVTATSAAPVFTAASPPAAATVGTPYSYTFTASGSPAPTFAVASGTLPGGLALNATSGVLSGTPTTAGSATFTVRATNGVSPDAVTGAITITVAVAGPRQITGTVTEAGSGLPLAGICVYLHDAAGVRTTDPGTCTSGAGTYTMAVANPGSYKVAFFDPGSLHVTQWFNNQPSAGAATPVTVGSGPTTGINAAMALTSPAIITGKITSAQGGAPLAGICVYLYNASTNARTSDAGTCSNTQGVYIMGVASAGSYKVGFLDPTGTRATQWANGKATQATADPVAVTLGRITSGVNAAMVSLGSISGTITAVGGGGFSGVCVYADNLSGTYTGLGACTNAAGSYTIAGFVPGSYKLGFYLPGDPQGPGAPPTTRWYNNKANEAAADPVVVSPGSTTSGIDQTFPQQF